MSIGFLAVRVDLGRVGGRKGQHVRGTVLLPPLAVQVVDECVVAEDDGELTFFQAEVGQDVVGYPFYRRCPGPQRQPRRTMSYGE